MQVNVIKFSKNLENDSCYLYVSDMVSCQWIKLVLGRGKAMPVTLADHNDLLVNSVTLP